MIAIDDKLVSEELLSESFACNLSACKGMCCVHGDAGAPVEPSEKQDLEAAYPAVEARLTEAGKKAIESQGLLTKDADGTLRTPLLADGMCAFAFRKNGVVLCGLESAYRDGEIDFKKPVSCELYPVRITKYEGFEAVNYERWDICSPACAHGKSLGMPVYRFVRNALIRKYGESFYEALDAAYQYKKDQEV